MPKNVKGGHWDLFQHSFCCRISENWKKQNIKKIEYQKNCRNNPLVLFGCVCNAFKKRKHGRGTLCAKFPMAGLGRSSCLVVLEVSVKRRPFSVRSVVWRKKGKKASVRGGHFFDSLKNWGYPRWGEMPYLQKSSTIYSSKMCFIDWNLTKFFRGIAKNYITSQDFFSRPGKVGVFFL